MTIEIFGFKGKEIYKIIFIKMKSFIKTITESLSNDPILNLIDDTTVTNNSESVTTDDSNINESPHADGPLNDIDENIYAYDDTLDYEYEKLSEQQTSINADEENDTPIKLESEECFATKGQFNIFQMSCDYIPPIDIFHKININTIDTGLKFNQPINKGDLPSYLRAIKFGDVFNQPILPGCLPEKLEILEFGRDFNQTIDIDVLPKHLQQLKFGENYNKPLLSEALPNNLRYLTFGESFNQPINKGELPAKLCSLTFGDNFNHRLASKVLPYNLRFLEFGRDFNQPIDEHVLPTGLFGIKFGDNFNLPIDQDILPGSLISLKFGNRFNCFIKEGILPEQLHTLQFGSDFDQPILYKTFSNYLRVLTLPDSYPMCMFDDEIVSRHPNLEITGGGLTISKLQVPNKNTFEYAEESQCIHNCNTNDMHYHNDSNMKFIRGSYARISSSTKPLSDDTFINERFEYIKKNNSRSFSVQKNNSRLSSVQEAIDLLFPSESENLIGHCSDDIPIRIGGYRDPSVPNANDRNEINIYAFDDVDDCDYENTLDRYERVKGHQELLAEYNEKYSPDVVDKLIRYDIILTPRIPNIINENKESPIIDENEEYEPSESEFDADSEDEVIPPTNNNKQNHRRLADFITDYISIPDVIAFAIGMGAYHLMYKI
jgi:hypothetical protein